MIDRFYADRGWPAPVPADAYIDNLYRSVEEGLITWQELGDLQATYLRDCAPVPLPELPRCPCGRPATRHVGKRPLCPHCFAAERRALAALPDEVARRKEVGG